jgi:hypothetical protein
MANVSPMIDDNDPDFQQFMEETKKAATMPSRSVQRHPQAAAPIMPMDDGSDPDYTNFLKETAATSAPPVPVDYANMGWGQVLKSGAKNLVPSAVNNLKAIPEAIYNYQDTAHALGQIGTGLYSKAEGLVSNQDPEKKSQNEAVLNELIKPYTSMAGFKESLATDPFSVLTTAAIPFTAGSSGLLRGAEALGEASTAGKVLSGASKVANAATYAFDPTKSALKVAGKLGDYGSGLAKTAIAGTTGAQPTSFEKAFAAGAAKGPNAAEIKNAFNQFATGQGNIVDFSQRASRAVEAIKNEDFNAWKQKKLSLTGSINDPVSMQPIYDAINEQRQVIGPKHLASDMSGVAAHDELDRLEGLVNQRNSLPDGDLQKSILGMDQLKVQLGQDALHGSAAPNQTWAVYNAIKKTMNDLDPEYQNIMDSYRANMDKINSLTKGLKAGPNVAANAELAAYLKAQKTPRGQSLINQVAQKDPLIPYMVAGADLHNLGAQGVSSIIEKGSAPFHIVNIGHALLSGNPLYVAGAVGTAIAQPVIQSPKLMGKAAYGLGALSASPVGGAANAAGTSMRYGNIPAANIQRAEQAEPDMDQASGGRIGRKSGGRIGNVAKAEAERLINLADRIKKSQSGDTKPLLNLDDTTVAKALAIANKGI